jgi:hypothetical protein
MCVFYPDPEDRDGTEKDKELLKVVLKKLDFDIKTYDDLTIASKIYKQKPKKWHRIRQMNIQTVFWKVWSIVGERSKI